MNIHDLDDFTATYIECLIWSGLDYGREDESGNNPPLDDNNDSSDLTQEAIASIVEECKDFQTSNAKDLEEWGDDSQAGHDFALTRNGHGAGFWDRGRGALGDRLTDACKPYGGQDLWPDGNGALVVQ